MIQKRHMIYTVTTVKFRGEIPTDSWRDSRCWGYYFDLKTAKRMVLKNYAAFNEAGYWPWIVIEGVKPGVGHVDRNEYWFVYDDDAQKYVAAEKPAYAQFTVCWGMG